MDTETDQVTSQQAKMSNEEILNEIKLYHAKSAASVSLAEVDQNNSGRSLQHYLESMRYCERGLKFTVQEVKGQEESFRMAKELQQGMRNTLNTVRQKVCEMQSFGGENIASSAPSSLDSPPPYSVQDPRGNYGIQSTGAPSANAETLLTIENGVQMYFVSNSNNVGVLPPTYPTSLKILLLVDECQDGARPEALLQVLDWVYPLAKYRMPVLLAKNGAYIFPNCTENGIEDGSAVGIVMSQEVGSEYKEMFESILHSYALFQREDRDEGFADLTEFVEPNNNQSDLSDRIANSVKNGAAAVSHGVKRGAEYATELVEKGSEKLKAKLSPNSDPLVISPKVKNGIQMTYKASNAAVEVSQWLVKWLCLVTSKVIAQLSGRCTPDDASNNGNRSENSDMCGVYKVAKASATGIGKIWIELEKAGSAIAKAVTTATTTNVEYKYGPQAGQAAHIAMGAAVNFGSTAIILNNLKFKTMAELTSKNESPRENGEQVITEPNGDRCS